MRAAHGVRTGGVRRAGVLVAAGGKGAWASGRAGGARRAHGRARALARKRKRAQANKQASKQAHKRACARARAQAQARKRARARMFIISLHAMCQDFQTPVKGLYLWADQPVK